MNPGLSIAELVDAYCALPAPFTKRRAVQVIVRSRLARSCNYFHRESAYGYGNKACRRAKLLLP